MQKLMEATLRRPRRAPVGRGVFFQGTDSGVVHIVRALRDSGRQIETVCGRRFELKGRMFKDGLIATPLPRRYRACKACAAAMQRALEHFRRGEL